MSVKKLLAVNVLAATLVACGGGDVNIAPSSNNNNTTGDTTTNITGTGGGTTFTCASYDDAGTTIEGTFDGTDCTYTKGFVDIGNPFLVDVTLPNIGSGVHIFEGSVVVGETYTSDVDLAAAGISEGGDGVVFTVEAGSTLAFRSSGDFMVINRGSQIVANGTQTAPITFTSQTDAVFGTVGAEDVGEWGGIIINGFGVTNKCDYTGTYPNLTLVSGCHVTAEGKASSGESQYGGNNNADNSGLLRYVVVKHTGYQVAPGNELNGIAFNAVGSGTVVENLEAYSTYDDGIEFFGGAVNVTNYVALYVRDDSIDIDEGYRGTITNALVIQSETDGNRCVESDGIGGYDGKTTPVREDFVARGLHSQPTIKNLTCLLSGNADATHGEGQGIHIREGHSPTIQNALVSTAYSGDANPATTENHCFLIEDDESEQSAIDGDTVVEGSIFACADLVAGDLKGGDTAAWLTAAGNTLYASAESGEDPTTTNDPTLVILDGFYSVPVADMVMDSIAVTTTPVDSTIIGAVSADDDWTLGWTYGLHTGSQGQLLWFE